MRRGRANSNLDLYIKLILEPFSEIIAKISKVIQKRSYISKILTQKTNTLSWMRRL